MVRIVMSPHAMTVSSVVARGLQCLLAMAALATVNSGFINISESGYTVRLGSHEATFSMLATYSSMIYAAWFVMCVELHPMVARPRRCISRAIDVTLAFFLLVSAIALAGSDYVQKGSMYRPDMRTKTLQAGVVLNFLAMVPLAATIALTYVTSNNTANEAEVEATELGYVMEMSPRPLANTPSSKV